MKKVVSLIICLALIMSLAVSVSAADITISGGIDGSEYSAYQLLISSQNSDGSSYGYTMNPKYKEVLCDYFGLDQELTNEELSGIIYGRLSALEPNSDDLYAFAKDIFDAIDDEKIQADHVSNDRTMENVAQGYYLIAETALSNNDLDTKSLLMLNTMGKETINVVSKESYPEINKQVYAANDSADLSGDAWREYADYDIGDEIPFQIVASVSGRYENYKNYWYKFDDTMTNGLVMKTKEVTEGETTKTVVDGMDIKIGDLNITEYFDIVLKDGNKGFTAEANLKDVEKEIQKTNPDFAITHNTKITVTYSGILTETAVAGVGGNSNTVILQFQNDPYATENPENPEDGGQTPPDTNVIFTFNGILNKVKEDGTTPLAGAKFKVEKWNKTSNKWVEVKELGGDDTVKFEFKGLDVGIYKLTETQAPAGYSPIVPFEFEVYATYDTSKNPVELKTLEIRDRDGDPLSEALGIGVAIGENLDTFTSNIVNKTGTALPTTGGMGTTVIYAVGALLVLAAVVMLVTKKRMTNVE